MNVETLCHLPQVYVVHEPGETAGVRDAEQRRAVADEAG
jgi:hypothetical protein